MGASIQFKGISDTVRAFEMREDEKFWAVFQSKNLLHRGEGSDDLRDFLDMIRKNGSAAIYTLKVYDDVTDVKQIRERTEASGSFNFTLDEYGEGRGDYYLRVKELEAKVKEFEDAEDDDDEGGVLGKLGNAAINLLSEPDKLIQVINGVKGIFQQPNAPQMITGIIREFAQPQQKTSTIEKAQVMPEQKNTYVPMTDDEKLQRTAAALTTLEKNDPKIIVHLEKLAELSDKNPQMFNFLIQNLENNF